LKLTEKYQKENLLDMIAICKIMKFENISEQTIKTFSKRIYQEILLEKSDVANNHFLSVSDIIYDEILQLPIIKSIQSIQVFE
jgi:AICAR transformylase/IMP cyclohydrolase PurH